MPFLRFTNLAALFFLVLGLFLFYRYPSFSSPQTMAEGSPKSIYDFTVKDILGNEVPLSNYRGKVLLIVNVASKCGLTDSNYKELNVLYEKYKDQGFEILAFPCNQFLWQEPGTNEEIQQTVCTRFKAEFPVFEKIDVNGDNAAPLFKFLKSEKGGFLGNAIKWNFTKFLVNKEGKVVERYAPKTPPLQFEKDIQNLLGSA
ncbi:Glutathione peroxidase 2 [Datura stramonium]|uniref:Glutathione peroxidase n=1 Tax=Datura stramonium TaxID=4076 RepID=A0ABS8TN10_DATST|nr:Glutathione peroxidase 2 [Datura stramonium]